MWNSLQVRVFENQQLAYSGEFDGTIELGRQSGPGETLYSKRFDSGRWRLVIASLDEGTVSRKHAQVEPLQGGMARVSNTSSLIPLRLPDNSELKPKEQRDLSLPLMLGLGRRMIRIESVESDSIALHGLSEVTIAPGRSSPIVPRIDAISPGSGAGTGYIDGESLVHWLQAVLNVLQRAASTPDFLPMAAQTAVESVGLDAARVMRYQDGEWRPYAVHSRSGQEPNWRPSRQILGRVLQEKRTFWQDPSQANLDGSSLVGVAAVVAAPILDGNGNVIGALYGERRIGPAGHPCAQFSKLEASLVELLSSGIAAGLARLEQEKAAVAARVRFEQFFTPELARELAVNPDLLKGRDVPVTLVFADIRGFSRMSERLGAVKTVEWIGDAMKALSDCVLAHKGVLVDYIGDEVIAMWGAPHEQPDHARLACLAALDMIARLPDVNSRWQSILGEPMNIGIGVNSGQAWVGNTGSSYKFKYGALGNTVNLASRVQGVNKYLKTQLLVTGSTMSALDESFWSRRVCSAGVVNIAQPVELHELVPVGRNGWPELKRNYETALNAFEAGDFAKATAILGNLLVEFPGDGPTMVLMGRAVTCLIEESTSFDPVWRLQGK